MKNITKLVLFASLVFCSFGVSAQKFAVINSDELISLMPELDSVEIKLVAFNKELSDQYEEFQVELNKKAQDYNAKVSTYSDNVKQIKANELESLREKLDNFRNAANIDLRDKNAELMAPVFKRAQEAIKKVAKEGGFLMVFDSSVGATLYVDEANVVDILPLVRKALGIPATAKPRTGMAAGQ